MAIYAYLFDAEGQDRQVKLDQPTLESVGDKQLLWVDVTGDKPEELQRVIALLSLSKTLTQALCDGDGGLRQNLRPRLDLYVNCFHLNIEALQSREDSEGKSGSSDVNSPGAPRVPGLGSVGGASIAFRVVPVHFVVFANIVVSLHEQPAAFLDNFDTRIKGDTDLGSLDGPAFLGAVLNWHITDYFRALEMLENEVDRIDDAALRLRRSREERDLLSEMVKVRRRLALVRRTLLPHREVYSTLSRPRFAPFVTEHATETLQLVGERMERAIEGTENGRELILGSFDIFTTQTALRTNEVVKALTVISALLLPAGVIASLASLFIRAPVYDLGRPGFWEVMASMVLIGVTFLTVARKRNWM